MSMTSNSHHPEQIEIITSVQRRRRWSSQEKLEIVEESELSGLSLVALTKDLSCKNQSTLEPDLCLS